MTGSFPLQIIRMSKAIFFTPPGVGARHEGGLDAGLLDIRQSLIKRSFMNQGAAFRADRDIAGGSVGLAQIAAARIECAPCIAVPIHKKTFRNRHREFPINGENPACAEAGRLPRCKVLAAEKAGFPAIGMSETQHVCRQLRVRLAS
jgi:hypothetical protein